MITHALYLVDFSIVFLFSQEYVLGDDPRRGNLLPALNFDAPPHACPFARYTTEQAEAERRRHLRMIAERDARRARRAQVTVTRLCRVRLCGMTVFVG